MSRLAAMCNISEFKYSVMQRIVSLDAEILSPELTLISARENFSIPWTMPTFLMLSQYELGLPDLEAPNLYTHKFSVMNLMPIGLDMTALLYGDQELPVALMIGPATGEIYHGTKGQVLAVVLKNTPIFDENEAESLDYTASFLATRLVELGRMISHVELHRGMRLSNFAPSRLFAAIPRVTHDDIDRLLATLRMLLSEVAESIDGSQRSDL